MAESLFKSLNVIANRELSANEIMDELGLKHKTNFRKRYLKPAIDNELI